MQLHHIQIVRTDLRLRVHAGNGGLVHVRTDNAGGGAVKGVLAVGDGGLSHDLHRLIGQPVRVDELLARHDRGGGPIGGR
ncbi:Uncharacterised protein [Mycobacteroides abscessus subsp. abscessus]|nr:Uncharacterised protein [Mycobacteroides abscessus subsp. abscessus]